MRAVDESPLPYLGGLRTFGVAVGWITTDVAGRRLGPPAATVFALPGRRPSGDTVLAALIAGHDPAQRWTDTRGIPEAVTRERNVCILLEQRWAAHRDALGRVVTLSPKTHIIG